MKQGDDATIDHPARLRPVWISGRQAFWGGGILRPNLFAPAARRQPAWGVTARTSVRSTSRHKQHNKHTMTSTGVFHSMLLPGLGIVVHNMEKRK